MSKGRVGAEMRRTVAMRARGCCEYCRSQVECAMQSFSIEHIEPRSLAGRCTLDNLAFACQGCNNHKYNKREAPDPATGRIVPLFHPRKQRWSEHFSWSDNYLFVLGRTPTGRATIEALNLNREGVVNLRGMLCALNRHPREIESP